MSVEPGLGSKSPRFTSCDSWPFAARSTICAAGASLPDAKTGTAMQSFFSFSGDAVFMLNSTANSSDAVLHFRSQALSLSRRRKVKVADDFSTLPVAGVRRHRHRHFRCAAGDHHHHPTHPIPWLRGARQYFFRRGADVPGFRELALSRDSGIAHVVYFGAVDVDAQLPRFGDGGVVHFGAGIDRVDPPRVALRTSSRFRNRSAEPAAFAVVDGKNRRVPPPAR